MFFLFLIIAIAGAVFYFYEQKNKQENERKMDEFVKEVLSNPSLNATQKKGYIKDAFLFNGFDIIKSDDKSITVSKKYFSIGACMMWFGLLGFSTLIYIAYYFLFKKPEIKTLFFA